MSLGDQHRPDGEDGAASVTARDRDRTAITRLAELGSRERRVLDQLLDEQFVGHVALVRPDGHPVILPTAIARDGDRLLIHGSTGSRWMRLAAAGAPVCVEVTATDGIIVARSAFESSLRYRSAVLFGACQRLEGPDKEAALDVLTERLVPGRGAEVRRPTAKELAATLVLALPITEWSLKVSGGWPDDGEEDVAGDAWAGVVPLAVGYGDPVPSPDLRPGIAVPESVRRASGRGISATS
jgi:nitroimidazol reductase NimA-like FMN-containing flavoprotein (pyridoxamine 5'-phosphate oxidase superfamily)